MAKNEIIVASVVSQGLGCERPRGSTVSRRRGSRRSSRVTAPSVLGPSRRSKRPHSNARATAPATKERIIELRKGLDELGADAGPDTIHVHLVREGLGAPSVSTIQRILSRRGFVLPAPKKRPKFLHPFRGRSAQRVLAERHDPLAPNGRDRGRDPHLPRRPLAPGVVRVSTRRCRWATCESSFA